MPEERPEAYRSCVLRIGTYIVIQNVLKEHKLPGMLEKHLSQDYGTRRSDYYIEALDRKIERLQEKDKEYSVLAEELYTLLDERHPERKIERAKQALYNAYVESERSLDEIIDLILQCLSVIMKFHAEIPEKGQ